MLGVEPIAINSNLLSGQARPRLYWTNIPNVVVPENKGVMLQDILEDGYCPLPKSRCLLVSDSRPLTTPVKMFHRFHRYSFTTLIFKDRQHYEDCAKYYLTSDPTVSYDYLDEAVTAAGSSGTIRPGAWP